MARMAKFTGMIADSVLHAPNLRRMTLTTRNGHKSNRIGREVVVRHLLALRFMNPSAEIAYEKVKEVGVARVDYTLWDGTEGGFDIKTKYDPELVVAKVMMAARDPDLDEA